MTSRRNMKITLAAMTLASSMILVDQTAVPLAAPHAIIGLHAEISQSQCAASGIGDGLALLARRRRLSA